jgi:hypothetical protein
VFLLVLYSNCLNIVSRSLVKKYVRDSSTVLN